MEPRRQTIPVILLVKTAFQLLWQQRDDALRLGLVPTLLLRIDRRVLDELLADHPELARGIITSLVRMIRSSRPS